MKTFRFVARGKFLGLGLTLLALVNGCFWMGDGRRKMERSSSVVAYLYPNQSNPLPPTDAPVGRRLNPLWSRAT